MSQTARIVVGSLLVIGGGVFLLSSLNLIELTGYLWAALVLIAGLGFLYVFISAREHWWALIPGFTLLSVATVIFVNEAFPKIGSFLSGSIILAGIGLSFWLIYLLNHENWWAVIPGGVLFTLAAVALLSETLGGFETGGLFFLGIGTTFGILYLLPTPEGRMKWAIFPALGCLFVGIVISVAATSVLNFVWPVILILTGLYILIRNFRTSQSE